MEAGVPDLIKLGQAWHVGDQLGAGGFAKVFLARDSSGETAVVKLIPKAPGAQRELLFVDLDNVPNVIPILDSGESGGFWVLVMPRAEKSLRDHLTEQGGLLTVNQAVSVLIDVAETLVAVEGRVVHRDIKPENILLLDGHWHLSDFGIARYAEATTAPDTLKYAMTRPYAAPEQWREDRASSATDVYALGVVAYEILTGRPPFQGPDYRHQHLEEAPEPITGIPERVRSLVSECLYKGPQSRPRPQNVVARLRASMASSSPAGELLQQANALAVARQTEEARQESIARIEAERRRDLSNAAEQSMDNVLALLHQQITANASQVQASSQSTPRTWSLNNATMRVDQPRSAERQEDERIPFDVVTYTAISIQMPADRPGYAGRSHSLWFCNAQEPDVFRWYETAFIYTFGGYNRRMAPFSMSPRDPDAALALSPALHTHQVAWPFTPIDQGDEEDFIERWIEWFAEAAQGRLGYPSSMPERNPQGSWRRGH